MIGAPEYGLLIVSLSILTTASSIDLGVWCSWSSRSELPPRVHYVGSWLIAIGSP